jgi:hypothetical protein
MNAAGHVQLFSTTPDAPVRWRLLSGNNRETGRGVESYADAESCRVGIKDLQATLDELDASVRRTGANQWVWQLLLDGQAVAVSGRSFDRLIRCEQGLAHFLEHIRDAEIGATLMVSSARRW